MYTATTQSPIGVSLYLFVSSKNATSSLVTELSKDVTGIHWVDSVDELLRATENGPGCVIVSATDALQLDFALLKENLAQHISVVMRGPVSADILVQFMRAGYSAHAVEHEQFSELAREELKRAQQRWAEFRMQAEFSRQLSHLTDRERQTYELVVHGLETRAIAASLGVAVGTAEKHKLSMLRKLSCSSATELLANLLAFTQSRAVN